MMLMPDYSIYAMPPDFAIAYLRHIVAAPRDCYLMICRHFAYFDA